MTAPAPIPLPHACGTAGPVAKAVEQAVGDAEVRTKLVNSGSEPRYRDSEALARPALLHRAFRYDFVTSSLQEFA
ncbi:MAG: hypothetical protein AB7G13_20505 [Lautropia sp.]